MRRALGLLLSFCLVLVACGGGGGGGSSDGNHTATNNTGGQANSTTSVSGVAATGSGIVGRIYIKDAKGQEQSVDTSDGTFQFTLTNFTAPFILKAEWTVNSQVHTLYSFSPDSGVANITPLTQMALVAATGTVDLDSIYAGSANFADIANALPAAIVEIKKPMAALLTKYGVSDIDIFTTPFAPDHTGVDALLDSIDVNFSAQSVVVADKNSGAIVFEAPATQLSHALAIPDWSVADAAVANDPDIAVDSNGRSLVVWSQYIGSNYVIRARFLDSDSASALSISNSGDAGFPRVVFDNGNSAIAVWTQYQNNRNTIWTSRYDAATQTWNSPQQISANSVADAYLPDIGIDGAGNAIATWYQGDGRNNHFDAWSINFSAAQKNWSAPQLVSDGVNSAYDVHIAMNNAGQGLLVWEQEQGDGTTVSNGPKDIYGRSVTSLGVYGASSRLNAVAGNIDSIYGQVAVAVDAHGNGGALWVQDNGGIHSAMFSMNSGWQNSAPITTNSPGSTYSPHLAFDGNGNALAVWQQQTGSTAYGASNRYVANVGWGSEVKIADDSDGDIYDPRIAVDAAGNATAVWYQWNVNTGSVTVDSARYFVNNGWGAAHLIANTNTDGFTTYPVPRVATNSAGQAAAIWGIDSY